MIVDSMTHAEVYRELERDREGLTRWWQHQKEALRRPLLKADSKLFPVTRWYDHTSPRHIRYLISTHILDKRMTRLLTGVGAVRQMADGITLYTSWMAGFSHVSPMVIIPHVCKRYAKRCNVKKTGTALIRHYFDHNAFDRTTDSSKVVARSVRYNGEDHLSCCVNEGVLLGHVVDDIFIARTFITYDMCGITQQQEFGRCRSLLPGNFYDFHRIVKNELI